MKLQIARIASFIISFVVALIVISAIMNSGNKDLMVNRQAPGLPLVYANVEGYYVNPMLGYTTSPEANYFRESLTPIPENRKLYIQINPYDAKVKNISYEVRSIDAQRLIESTTVYDYIVKDNYIMANFDIKDLIERDQEYILITILELEDGRNVRYYTRIIWYTELNAAPLLKFVSDFHTKTFDKNAAKDITAYLESNAEGDNSNYGNVDIHSSFKQITWGDLIIDNVGDSQITIVEMDSTTACIMLDSIVEANGPTGLQKHKIREYFRIRSGNERTYLLDYERTMDQYFDPSDESFSKDAISLGITSKNVNMQENMDGKVVLFTQENELYAYNSQTARLSLLFSFSDSDNFDARTINDKYGMKVISIDEAGNARFLVYGYNCRGRHEGEVGVSLYTFNIGMNTIREEVYIPYNKSFALLADYIDRMSYINRRDELFLYIDETVYRIDIDEKKTDTLVSGLSDESLVVSKSNQLISWKDKDDDTKIYLMDMNSGNITEITCNRNESIVPLGFVGEDLVYGISDNNSFIKNINSNTGKAISKIIIQDKKGNILKEYAQDNVYVTNVTFSDNNIKLNRLEINEQENYYSFIDDDQITYNFEEEKQSNTVTYALTKDFETVTQINLVHGNVNKTVNLQTPGEMLFEGSNQAELVEYPIEDSRYYVYLQNRIYGVFTRPEEAINLASLIAGTAVRDNEENIWQRGNRKTRVQIRNIEEKQIQENSEDMTNDSLAVCLDVICEHEGKSVDSKERLYRGETVKTILKNNLDVEVLELKGCDLATIMYYIDKGTPVIANAGAQGYVIIIGYDELNTIIMDPISGSIHKVGMNDSIKLFEEAGNRYITYITKG